MTTSTCTIVEQFSLDDFLYIKFITPNIGLSENLKTFISMSNTSTIENIVYIGYDLYESINENAIITDRITMTFSSSESYGIMKVFNIKSLKPNTVYYLRIFLSPAPEEETNEVRVTINDSSEHKITISHTGGIIYISNGSTFAMYECCIDNGTSWDAYIPYIDNGTSWDLCGHWDSVRIASVGLAHDSWETISAVSKTGSPEEYYAVGDEKNITLTTGEVITLTIIGFNHDDLSDGTGKAGITFQMKNLLATTYNMNSSDTNSGSWGSSAMRTRLQPNGGIYETLPSDVKSVIRPVNKITSAGGSSTSLVTTSDYAFLLSEIEIFGALKYSVAGQGSRYNYYGINDDNNIKYLPSGESAVWWERSPRSGYSSQFCAVAPYSTFDNRYSARNASVSHGISFAFCV